MGLEAVGPEPSVVYRMTATPVPESTAERLTVAGGANQAPEHGLPLQAMDEVGAV
jgi:hypothetical protein